MTSDTPPLDDEKLSASAVDDEEVESRWWELDLRSLALARIALGLFVLLTIAISPKDMAAFFTDAGVLPREVLVRSPFADLWLSFHMGSGSLHTQVLLNGLLGLFALGLIAGWRTPYMVLGCWVLLNSLQARNPFICDRGDSELVLVLFWGVFLPLGGRWSMDAKAGRRPFGSASGVGAAGLVLQFGLIYLFAAYLKSGPFWLTRGDGLEHCLISPLFSTKLSLWLAANGGSALPLLNYGVIAGELFVALLLLCPWAVPLARGLSVAMLLAFHLSVGLLFQLGLFPWLGALLPLALLPREFWEGPGTRLAARLDRLFGSEVEQESVGHRLAWVRTAFLLYAIALTVMSNLLSTPVGSKIKLPGFLIASADGLRLSQHWELFSPLPPYYGWFELRGRGAKEAVTVFAGPPTREDPSLSAFPSHRWRMLMIASLYPEFALVRPGIAGELAARAGWNGEASGLSYVFKARLPDPKGKLAAPVEWPLWTAPQAFLPAASGTSQDHNHERGHDERGQDEHGHDERGQDEHGHDERGQDEHGHEGHNHEGHNHPEVQP